MKVKLKTKTSLEHYITLHKASFDLNAILQGQELLCLPVFGTDIRHDVLVEEL